ncbi:MAG: hypothetical protein ABS873_05805 [Alkalibacterium sp.]
MKGVGTMEWFTGFVIVASVIIMMIEVMGIRKAIQENYDSKWITYFRGWNVAALFKERDVRDERVKTLLLIHNGVNLIILAALNYLYFSGMFFNMDSYLIIFILPLISYVTRLLIDWRIKKVLRVKTV